MPGESLHVTEAEIAVLERLWELGPCGVRPIAEQLYPDKGTSGYTTVQKLLERLEAKGCVSRDRSRFAHVFSAAVDRDEIIGQQLQAVADKLCHGSSVPLLMNLVQKGRLNKRQRDALRRMLDDCQ